MKKFLLVISDAFKEWRQLAEDLHKEMYSSGEIDYELVTTQQLFQSVNLNHKHGYVPVDSDYLDAMLHFIKDEAFLVIVCNDYEDLYVCSAMMFAGIFEKDILTLDFTKEKP